MITFILVVLALFLIPGPAVFLTVARSVSGGRKAGIYTGIGIAVGDLIHTVASVLGLSAILMTSAFAFGIVKYLGAAYLVYLGVKAILEKPTKQDMPNVQTVNPGQAFRQAVWIELLNPKTALFFLAFLPQFVRPEGHPVILQLLILGLTFVAMSIIYTTLLAFAAGSVGQWLNRQGAFSHRLGKVVGTIYIGLGLQLVFQNRN